MKTKSSKKRNHNSPPPPSEQDWEQPERVHRARLAGHADVEPAAAAAAAAATRASTATVTAAATAAATASILKNKATQELTVGSPSSDPRRGVAAQPPQQQRDERGAGPAPQLPEEVGSRKSTREGGDDAVGVEAYGSERAGHYAKRLVAALQRVHGRVSCELGRKL